MNYNPYRLEKLRDKLKLIAPRVVRETVGPEELLFVDPAEPRFDLPPDDAAWRPANVGDRWGGKRQWTYVRSTLTPPKRWPAGQIAFRLKVDKRFTEFAHDDNFAAGPEHLIFVDGENHGSLDEREPMFVELKPGRAADIRAVLFAGRAASDHRLATWDLAWIDGATYRLHRDLQVALDLIDVLDEASPGRERLIRAVEAAIGRLDFRSHQHQLAPAEGQPDPGHERFYATAPDAAAAFAEGLEQVAAAGETPRVLCVGHAHIDLAWLWPTSITRHKNVRTFARQCRLLERYDGWSFFQSSPQAYAWLEEDAPELFERVKRQIEAGRWEADGATWVEMDTNVPSGESLVRQLLYGRRYFREKLGVESKLLWLPDVFGYSAALPQLLRLAGVEGFLTSKISWSQFNRFPHDSFRWRGLDGSEVVTQFITMPATGPWAASQWLTDYNAQLNPRAVTEGWRRYRQHHRLIEPIASFGYGDGGGGPTESMLEIGERLADWPLPDGAAGVRFGQAGEQMRKIAEQADDLPVWDGELYLEYHRGTYTSQAWLKRANRRCEIALHDAEWTASLARLVGVEVDWDQEAIDKLWQNLLLAQFHDILPGSSVHEVYEEFRPIMRHVLDSARAVAADQVERLAAAIDTREFTRPVVLLNPLSWDRTEPVALPDGRWVDHVTVPAAGWTVIDADAATVTEEPVVLSVDEAGRQLTNGWWRLRLDDHGRIVELHDRVHDRPVITPDAPGNQWQVFEDRPFRYDAWDIEYYHEQQPLPGPTCTSIEVVETGEQRLVVELVWHMPAPAPGNPETEEAGSRDAPAAPRSEIRQHLILYGRSPRIDFQTIADWHEHHQLLKVAFPVNVRAREANYEIQFGHLTRPTHRNTSWDFARFEVCGHRWIDLAEPGYGVAMLNDCKYGHSVHEHVMRMTCIKSAQQPDATADQGRHEFTYALLPHAGSLQDAGVIRHAAELNQPILVQPTEPSEGDLPAEHRAIACDHPAVIVDTLKPAEDGDGLILRAYESHGSHVRVTLELAAPPKSVALCDLLEQPIAKPETPIEHEGQTVGLSLRPFQVITLRLKV